MGLRILPAMEQREEWRAIPGFAGRYEVSNLGRVRSFVAHGGKRRLDTPHLLTTRPNVHGYRSVGLQVANRPRAFVVHSLVALAFLGPRPHGLQVAHGDGDRMNSRLSNLRYATAVENAADRVAHGTEVHGERNGNAKITAAQAEEIRRRNRRGERQVDLAREFGISQSQISNIARRAAWARVSEAEGKAS